MAVELKKHRALGLNNMMSNYRSRVGPRKLILTSVLGSMLAVIACGRVPTAKKSQVDGDKPNSAAENAAAAAAGSGVSSAAGSGVSANPMGGSESNSISSLQLAPGGGSWTTQDVIPLPPNAIITAFSRVLEVKPTLSNEERYALGEIQMDFRNGRNVRLTPILGVPPLSYMQTLRSVAFRVCKSQIDAELSKAAAQRWFPDGKPPTAQSLGQIYGALTGAHKVTPEILEYAKSVTEKFNAIPVGLTMKDDVAVKNTMLCMYVLTDPLVILR